MPPPQKTISQIMLHVLQILSLIYGIWLWVIALGVVFFRFYARIEISKRSVHNINTIIYQQGERGEKKKFLYMNLINFILTYYILFLDPKYINQIIFLEFE